MPYIDGMGIDGKTLYLVPTEVDVYFSQFNALENLVHYFRQLWQAGLRGFQLVEIDSNGWNFQVFPYLQSHGFL